MAHVSANTPVEAGSVSRIRTALQGLSNRFEQYRTYRRTLNELQALTNRELADLGIHRSEIRRVSYHAAYQ